MALTCTCKHTHTTCFNSEVASGERGHRIRSGIWEWTPSGWHDNSVCRDKTDMSQISQLVINQQNHNTYNVMYTPIPYSQNSSMTATLNVLVHHNTPVLLESHREQLQDSTSPQPVRPPRGPAALPGKQK